MLMNVDDVMCQVSCTRLFKQFCTPHEWSWTWRQSAAVHTD